MQAAHARRGERREHQGDDFAVAGDAGLAIELGADLHDFARLRDAGRERAQHAAGVAQSRQAGFVQQMGVDARDLRRDVGAHAEQAAGQRIDDLERLQFEVAAGAGQQRFEVLDQRRLHEPVAVRAEVIEQRAAQRLDALGLAREDVLDMLGQHPLTQFVSPSSPRARWRSTRGR